MEKHFVQLIKEHLKTMDLDERVAYLARMLWGSQYGWGKEQIGSTDCSGSICWSLWLMNYKIRTTAHGFRFQFSQGFEGMPKPGYLAFWYHPDGKKIKHVAIFSDAMLIMNARNRFCDQPLSLEIKRRAGAKYELRRLDWDALATASAEGRSAFGVDDELFPLRGLFDEETL